jgi:hypothetical protein
MFEREIKSRNYRDVFILFKEEHYLEIYQDVIVSSEKSIANESWFQKNACNRTHNCQNDDSETIKKKKKHFFEDVNSMY